MSRKAPMIVIEEEPGDKYPDLESAQNAALSLLSANLQTIIRDLIARGALMNVNGKIIPNTKEKTE